MFSSLPPKAVGGYVLFLSSFRRTGSWDHRKQFDKNAPELSRAPNGKDLATVLRLEGNIVGHHFRWILENWWSWAILSSGVSCKESAPRCHTFALRLYALSVT